VRVTRTLRLQLQVYRRRSGEAGFDRHMTKPADPEALRAVLSRVRVHG